MSGSSGESGGPDAEAESLARMGALPRLPKKRDPSLAPIHEDEFAQGIAARFRSVAQKVPDNVAIWTVDRRVTYRELDRASSALAARLMARGLSGQGPVALGTRDAIGHVVGLLGILKAGGYYLPVSHLQPPERRRAILDIVKPAIAVATHEAEAAYFDMAGGVEFADIADAGAEAPAISAWPAPAQAAFVLFTSGSTGTPKGVVQSQGNLMRNTSWQTEALSIDGSDRFSQLHADGTMGAVRATLNALLNGACLCPFEISSSNLTAFGEWVGLAKPTVLHSAASFFRVFGRSLPDEGQLASVRLMILGGEAVTGDDFQLFRKRFPAGSHLCTGLGSTETTTTRMMCLPHTADPVLLNGRLPLGFPVPGTRISLAESSPDDDGRGTIGEMELQSITLFPGYWPVESMEAPERGSFRMGDLALRTHDGVLYHMGRKDHQVKVNGNRVDLLEIERAVLSIPGVSEACCIAEALQGSNAKLLLFVRGDDPLAVTIEKVRYFLRRWFPAYMRPGSIFLRDSLPRIAGGKIDLAQLRESAKQLAGADPLEALASSKSGAYRDLVDCFSNTSYPFLRYALQGRDGRASFDELDISALPIDSLSALEICMNLETRFGTRIDPVGLLSFRRFEDLLKEVRRS